MVTSTQQEVNVEQEMVYVRLNDRDATYVTYPLQKASVILFNERNMCDDCFKNLDAKDNPGSVYKFPTDKGKPDLMLMLCDNCIDDMGGPLNNKEFSK